MSAHLQVNIEQAPEEAVTIETVLTRGVDTVMPEKGLGNLMQERRVRLYLGIDPTSPYLHIGHMVPLRKLRQFQQLGHDVFLLFGTFTGMIGDPSDKTSARVQLSQAQVDENVATYVDQAGMILDLSSSAQNRIQTVYNHEWLQPLSFEDIITLASHFTVNQMLGRKTYQDRIKSGEPLYLHEMMYPIMQGYDSVALDVDLEIGGKDQIPNMLAGTHLIERMNHHQKWVMGMQLIEDPSGAKMGKTTGNVVNIVELPEVVYEALMTWPDATIALGLELLTGVPMDLVRQVEQEFRLIGRGRSQENPVALKEAFAYRVVADLQGVQNADVARQIFDLVKRQKQLPPRMKDLSVYSGTRITEVMVGSGLASDVDEARSRIKQQAVWIDRTQVRKDMPLSAGEYVIEFGKNSIKNVRRIYVS